MNEQMIEQQNDASSHEAVALIHEVSDEALEAAGGRNGLGGEAVPSYYLRWC